MLTIWFHVPTIFCNVMHFHRSTVELMVGQSKILWRFFLDYKIIYSRCIVMTAWWSEVVCSRSPSGWCKLLWRNRQVLYAFYWRYIYFSLAIQLIYVYFRVEVPVYTLEFLVRHICFFCLQALNQFPLGSTLPRQMSLLLQTINKLRFHRAPGSLFLSIRSLIETTGNELILLMWVYF